MLHNIFCYEKNFSREFDGIGPTMARTKVKKKAHTPAVPPRPVPVAAPAPHAPAVAEGTDAEEKMDTVHGKKGELHRGLPRRWRVSARCGDALFQSSWPFFLLTPSRLCTDGAEVLLATCVLESTRAGASCLRGRCFVFNSFFPLQKRLDEVKSRRSRRKSTNFCRRSAGHRVLQLRAKRERRYLRRRPAPPTCLALAG
jgi:hypothetical protein